MLAIILLVTFQTLYRYALSRILDSPSLAVQSEELARFVFIWISYLAVPLAIKSRSSIRVDILYNRLSPRLQTISWIVVDLCSLALAIIATCMFFASISGSGPATVAAIGSLTIPAMIERGYDKYFATAVVAAAGAIGVMIPPSPLHLGVIMVVNLAIGFVTPPVGVNLFVASGVAGVRIEGVSRVVLPLLGLMIAVLLVITFFPGLSLFLVD